MYFVLFFSFIRLILHLFLAIGTAILSYIYKFFYFFKAKRFVFAKKERPPRDGFKTLLHPQRSVIPKNQY